MQKAAIIFIIAFLYALTAKLSFSLAAPNTVVSPIWPPAGIALSAVLILGDVALFGIFIGCFIANAHMFLINGISAVSLVLMLIPATGAAIQAYVSKIVLMKFSGSYNIFENTHSVLIFIFVAAFGSCLINASLSIPFLLLTGRMPLNHAPYQWLTWWIADAVGVVVVTSLIIAWNKNWRPKLSGKNLARLIIIWSLILITGYVATHSKVEIAYVFIPFAIWAAFQFDIRFALLTGLLISAVGLYDAIYTSYHVMNATSINASISLTQLFITIIYLTILLMHAILSDREKIYDNLQLLNIQLEKLVLVRTSDLFDSNKQLEVEKDKAIKALEALKQSHARLMQSEKMASLGVLTAGVAHEIKHPLNATTANMESIKKNIEQFSELINQSHSDENIKKDFHQVQENIKALIAASHVGITRTAGVIADLCAFSRLDEPEMVITDVNRSIDSTLNLLSSEIKNNITIMKEYNDIPQLLCHPGKINQVIMNILVNALHALQTRPDSKIIIKTEAKNHAIIISIKDNGPGMKKEVLNKLFTPFMTTKTGGMGSGLGLFISNNIIKEHRGKIKVLSELDKGTEFVITLPVQEE